MAKLGILRTPSIGSSFVGAHDVVDGVLGLIDETAIKGRPVSLSSGVNEANNDPRLLSGGLDMIVMTVRARVVVLVRVGRVGQPLTGRLVTFGGQGAGSIVGHVAEFLTEGLARLGGRFGLSLIKRSLAGVGRGAIRTTTATTRSDNAWTVRPQIY